MGATLDHIMIVVGELPSWAARPRAFWVELADTLGATAAAGGARWLTIRPYGEGEPRDRALTVPDSADPGRAVFEVGVNTDQPADRCTVIVDPRADGRRGFAAAAARAAAADALDEKGIIEALYAPAESEPDLIVICGERDRLPPSLVWELAYGELVYVADTLDTLAARPLERAIGIYNTRTRRFGGL